MTQYTVKIKSGIPDSTGTSLSADCLRKLAEEKGYKITSSSYEVEVEVPIPGELMNIATDEDKKQMSVEFLVVKAKFLGLCSLCKLTPPNIGANFSMIDGVTSYEVRIGRNLNKVDTDYHARHLFGHWLCCIGVESSESDKVADLIGNTLLRGLEP